MSVTKQCNLVPAATLSGWEGSHSLTSSLYLSFCFVLCIIPSEKFNNLYNYIADSNDSFFPKPSKSDEDKADREFCICLACVCYVTILHSFLPEHIYFHLVAFIKKLVFGPGRWVPKSYCSSCCCCCCCCCCCQFSKGPAISKAFLIHSGAQQNFAYAFMLQIYSATFLPYIITIGQHLT